MTLERCSLSELAIEDEASFRHVGLYAELKRTVTGMGACFLAPKNGSIAWDRALLLNLIAWEPGLADVLPSRDIPADVVAHVAFHHIADTHVKPSVEAHLLAESIASAFDVYLIGRLLGHSPDASFLESQVPRMAEVAGAAGLDEDAFEALLEAIAAAPETAFRDLRALLFDASVALITNGSPEATAAVLSRFDDHRFAPILHHFELATWVLRARLERAQPDARWDDGGDARRIDALLREEPDPLGWIERNWLGR